MHPYTVKNWLWVVILLLFIVMALAGCSSAPKQSRLINNQYCHTSQTIETTDKQVVSSKTLVKCTDDPIERYAPARLGLAKDCIETYLPVNRDGRLIQEKVYACRKLNGVYDVVDASQLR